MPTTVKWRVQGKRLASWCGAILVSLLFTEGVLRVVDEASELEQFLSIDFENGNFVPDAERFWRLNPTGKKYLANKAGLRGWWPDRDKLDNELRILCIGDSCTFGHGVRCEDAYGMRLERLLQERLPGHVVRTVLGALPGYSTKQSLALLERHAGDLRPNLTVFYCGTWNDYVPAMLHNDDEWMRRRNSLLKQSRVAQLIERFAQAQVCARLHRGP